MANFIPRAGSKVFVQGLAPYDKLLSDVEYTIIGDNLISKLVQDGLDPFTEVYAPAGLTIEDMNADSQAGISIVTLTTGSNGEINIPHNKLNFNPTFIKYNGFGIGLNLGVLPSDTDFKSFEDELKALCLSRLGIEVTSTVAQITGVKSLTVEEHESLVAMREVPQRNKFNVFTQNKELILEIERLKTLNEKFKTCIANK